jgi:hypothetical protein
MPGAMPCGISRAVTYVRLGRDRERDALEVATSHRGTDIHAARAARPDVISVGPRPDRMTNS